MQPPTAASINHHQQAPLSHSHHRNHHSRKKNVFAQLLHFARGVSAGFFGVRLFFFWLFRWLSGWLIWGENGFLFIWSADDPFCVCLAEGVVAMSADAEGLMAVKQDGACEHWPVQDFEDDGEQLV